MDIQPFSPPQTAKGEPHAVRSPNRTRFGCGLDPKPNRNRTVADNTEKSQKESADEAIAPPPLLHSFGVDR